MIYTGSIAENLIPEKTLGETVQQLLNTDIGGFSLGNILAAVVIFLVCLVLIKLCLKFTRRALEKTRLDDAIKRIIVSVERAVLWVTAAIVILGQLNISTTSLVRCV